MLIDLFFFSWMQLAQDVPQAGVPWWVWIFLAVFLIFLLAGMWLRWQGKGVVKPEKDMIGAAAEPKSQPRPRPNPAAGPAPQPLTRH
jgi:hypothetical protein